MDQRGGALDPEILALWERYKATGDAETREELILHYAPVVKYVASRVRTGLPDTIETADLVSYGMFGLLDALEKFEVEKGFKFETYAITRIRGAIIDELRQVDWVPRSVRSKARKIEQAMQRLSTELKRDPSDEELADDLGLTVEELADQMLLVSQVSVAQLDQSLGNIDGEGVTLKDTIADDAMPSPEGAFDDAEMKEILRDTIARLSEREQTVLGLYYFENFTLAQIGDVLGVTESRICQIHAKAVINLRNKLQERITG